MAPHEYETETTRGEMTSPALSRKEDAMSATTMNGENVQHELQELEKAQAVQAAVQAGAQATQAAVQAGGMATMAAAQAGTVATMAAAQAGTVATVAAGGIGLVVGMFLGLAIANRHVHSR